MTPPLIMSASVPDWIGSVSTAVGVAVGSVVAFFARKQLLEGRVTQRRQRVYDLQQRFDDDIFPLMDGLIAFLKTDRATAKAEWDASTDDAARRRQEVSRAFNFFEQVSSEYNFGLLDPRVAHQTLMYVAVVTWPTARWFVQSIRDSATDDRILDQWETAYERARGVYQPPF